LGHFVEQIVWSHLVRDNVAVSVDAARARQTLTLSQESQTLPDLSRVDPRLIGPILDLFTFYVDLKLAASQSALIRAGDNVYLRFGVGGSWADGTRTILGEDAVDFDVTLAEARTGERVATVIVKHVPPANTAIHLPSRWMIAPVSSTPNNWIDVTRTGNGHYRARVGQENFTVVIRASLDDGRMLSATMDNPVEVSERICADAALTNCAAPIRSRIRRQIELTSRQLP
jgi:hypothetical protein